MSTLNEQQRERLTDIIGDASWCSDNECSCHRLARTAQLVLDGEENYEVINGE